MELRDFILRAEKSESQAQSDHVPLAVVVRVGGVTEEVQPSKVLRPDRVEVRVQPVQVRRLVEGVQGPVEGVHSDHGVV